MEAEDDAGERAWASTEFETGRMDTIWSGRWITDGEYRFKEAKISPKTMTFRTRFSCEKEIASARLYVTALGIYELLLNGEKVGQDYFAPGFTSYRNQLQYQTYDVTDTLNDRNELLAVVGGGWAVGSFTYKRRNRVYAKRQALLGELRICIPMERERQSGQMKSGKVTEEGNYKETEFTTGKCMMPPWIWRKFLEKSKLRTGKDSSKDHGTVWSAGTCTRRVSSGTDYKSKERYADL